MTLGVAGGREDRDRTEDLQASTPRYAPTLRADAGLVASAQKLFVPKDTPRADAYRAAIPQLQTLAAEEE